MGANAKKQNTKTTKHKDGSDVPSDVKTANAYEVLPGRYFIICVYLFLGFLFFVIVGVWFHLPCRYWLVGYDSSGFPVYKQEVPTEPDLMSQLCG